MRRVLLTPVSEKVLNSWKEIAQYLERGVRTVQRWEAELGLPVRRPRGRKRSAVIAVCSEIDEWISACPIFVADQDDDHAPRMKKTRLRDQLGDQRRLNETILQSRLLRSHVRRSRLELAEAVHRLVDTVTKIESRALPPADRFRVDDPLLDLDVGQNARLVG